MTDTSKPEQPNKIKSMKKINSISEIDYKTNPEGRLLFAALTLLTTNPYSDKTPDEVLEIVNTHADSFLNEN